MNKLTKNQVYAVLNKEREYQDQHIVTDPTRSDGSDKSVGDYLVLIDHYTRRAQDAWCQEPGQEGALHELRKLGALVVRCMEEHGVPERYVYTGAVATNPPSPSSKDWYKGW